MRKKKRIPVSIMLLVFLFLLTGCTLGGTKQEAETKVDYYIRVIDDNAPYYYEEDGLPKDTMQILLQQWQKKNHLLINLFL